ncbi:MAG: hypothetical protein U9P63_00915 [Patescibacteria group bacterium]|nr:hypothetical protein [Patescibacteria group bacterium]
MLNSNKYKSLLILVCVGIIAIPFIKIILPTPTAETQKFASVSGSVSVSSSASGIFIVPPGGKEVSRDTTGHKFFPDSVGEIVIIQTIEPKNPKGLFFLNESGSRIRIKPGLTRIRIISIGKKPYVSFANYSNANAKIKICRS